MLDLLSSFRIYSSLEAVRSGSGVFSATGISLWPTEEVAAMVVTVYLLFNESDVSDIFLFVLKLV